MSSFQKGQKLKVVDLSGFNKFEGLTVGDIVEAATDPYTCVPGGATLVKVTLASGSISEGFYTSRFEAFEPEPELEHPETVYFVEDEYGDTFLTASLDDIDEGSSVAVFKFERVGTLSRPPQPSPFVK